MADTYVLRPNGRPGTMGAVSQHTKFPALVFPENYQYVNEASSDDDANYLYNENAPDTAKKDAYHFEDLPDIGTRVITSVQLVITAKALFPDGGARLTGLLFNSGASYYSNTIDLVNSASYAEYTYTFNQDPILLSNFSRTNLNNYAFGYDSFEYYGASEEVAIRISKVELRVTVESSLSISPQIISSLSTIPNVNVTVKKIRPIKPEVIYQESYMPPCRLAMYTNRSYPDHMTGYWGRFGNSAVLIDTFYLQDRVLAQLARNNNLVTFSEATGLCDEQGLDFQVANRSLTKIKAINPLIKLGISVNGKIMFAKGRQSYGTLYKQAGGGWNTAANGSGSSTATYSGQQFTTGKDLYLYVNSVALAATSNDLFRIAATWVDGGGTTRNDLLIFSQSFTNQHYYKITLPYSPSSARTVTSFSVALDNTNFPTGSTISLMTLQNTPALSSQLLVDPDYAPSFFRVSKACLNIFNQNNWFLQKDGFPSRSPTVGTWRGPAIPQNGTPNLLVYNGVPQYAVEGQLYFDITNQHCVNYYMDKIKSLIYDNALNVQGVDLDHIFWDEITGGSQSLNIENTDDNIWIANFGSKAGLLQGPINGKVRLSKADTNSAWQEAVYYMYKRFKELMPKSRLYINGPAQLNSDCEGRMSQNITQTTGVVAGSPSSSVGAMSGDLNKTPISKRFNVIHADGYSYPPQDYNTDGTPAANFTDTELWHLRVWPSSSSTNLWITGTNKTTFEQYRRFAECMGAIFDGHSHIDNNIPFFNWSFSKKTYDNGVFGVPIEYLENTATVPQYSIVAGTSNDVYKRVFSKAVVFIHIGVTVTPRTFNGGLTTLQPLDGIALFNQTISPSVITSNSSIIAPALKVGGAVGSDIRISPLVISSTSSIVSPALRTGRVIVTIPIAASSTILGPAIKYGSQIKPTTIVSTATIIDPQLRMNQRIVTETLLAFSNVLSPAVLSGKKIIVDVLVSSSSLPRPALRNYTNSLAVIRNTSYMVLTVKGWQAMSSNMQIYVGMTPSIEDTLLDQDGNPIDISNMEIVLYLDSPRHGVATAAIPSTYIPGGYDNKAIAQLDNSHLMYPGIYKYQFKAIDGSNNYKSTARKFRVRS